jgi:hypothetical protein
VEQAPNAYWNDCLGKDCIISAVGIPLIFNSPKPPENGFAIDESLSFDMYKSNLLEDGSSYKYFLSTHPKWVPYGGVRGFYDLSKLVIQWGDHFVARIGFVDGAKGSDGVTYSLYFSPTYPDPGNPEPYNSYTPILIGNYYKGYDNRVNDWVIDLPKQLIGQSGWFILEVDAGNTADYDWAVWIEARLERP